MVNGYSNQILTRIEEAPEGTVFVNSDFLDIAKTDTVRRNLKRIIETKKLRRILNGVYEKS